MAMLPEAGAAKPEAVAAAPLDGAADADPEAEPVDSEPGG